MFIGGGLLKLRGVRSGWHGHTTGARGPLLFGKERIRD
jgi:hypothetical protein